MNLGTLTEATAEAMIVTHVNSNTTTLFFSGNSGRFFEFAYFGA